MSVREPRATAEPASASIGAARALEGEPAPPPSQEASVVLDIGGDIGAAVVYCPAELSGTEIEIRGIGLEWTGVHTAVRERRLRRGVQYAAVFGALPAGSYELRLRGDPSSVPVARFAVSGGEITMASWPHIDRPLQTVPAGA